MLGGGVRAWWDEFFMRESGMELFMECGGKGDFWIFTFFRGGSNFVTVYNRVMKFLIAGFRRILFKCLREL